MKNFALTLTLQCFVSCSLGEHDSEPTYILNLQLRYFQNRNLIITIHILCYESKEQRTPSEEFKNDYVSQQFLLINEIFTVRFKRFVITTVK